MRPVHPSAAAVPRRGFPRDADDYFGLPSLSLFPALRVEAETPMRAAAARLAHNRKQCATCKRSLPLDAFAAEPRALDGKRGSCRDCENAKGRAAATSRAHRSAATRTS